MILLLLPYGLTPRCNLLWPHAYKLKCRDVHEPWALSSDACRWTSNITCIRYAIYNVGKHPLGSGADAAAAELHAVRLVPKHGLQQACSMAIHDGALLRRERR